MSTTIKPTVGRKVWFYAANRTGTYDPQVPFDATVIYVWNDSLVNLRVTDHAGATSVRTSVNLRDPGEGDAHGSNQDYATWMPYQVGQAKAAAS